MKISADFTKKTDFQQGFTLIEVMVSLAMISIMAIMAYHTVANSSKIKKITEKRIDRYAKIRTALNKLSRDLRMAYVSLGEDMNQPFRRTYFKALNEFGGIHLSFSTFAHNIRVAGRGESESCIVEYTLIDDENHPGKLALLRRETHRLEYKEASEIPGDTWVILDNIEALEFSFYDSTRDEWLEEWNTTSIDGQSNRLPMYIRIHLVANNIKNYPINFYTTVAPQIIDGINLMPYMGGNQNRNKGGFNKNKINFGNHGKIGGRFSAPSYKTPTGR